MRVKNQSNVSRMHNLIAVNLRWPSARHFAFKRIKRACRGISMMREKDGDCRDMAGIYKAQDVCGKFIGGEGIHYKYGSPLGIRQSKLCITWHRYERHVRRN